MRLLFALIALAHAFAHAADLVSLQPFATDLAQPVEIVHAGDGSGRLFVLEQAGRIRVVERDGSVRAQPFLDIVPLVRSGDEQGLLGIAFHPRFASNGFFYVYYTAPVFRAAGSTIMLVRYSRSAADPDAADPASAHVILSIPHVEFANHNGGKILFGPDGYLYVGVGDGGGGGDPFGAARNLRELRGKILRIDVDGAVPYAIPASNPFAGRADARGEVYAFGLRNPWRFSFDAATNDFFVGDVGQDTFEEVDYVPAGSLAARNFGWPAFEATHCFRGAAECAATSATLPVIEYAHDSAGGISVTGGYRYRGRDVPQLFGRYVYGDFGSGRIWAAVPGLHGRWSPIVIATTSGVSSFGVDEAGELYVASYDRGIVYRITAPEGTVPVAPEASALRRWFR